MLQTVYYDFLDQSKTDEMMRIKELPEMKKFHFIHQAMPLPEQNRNAICLSDQEKYCLEAIRCGYPVIFSEDHQSEASTSMEIRYVIMSMDALSKNYLEEVYARFYKEPLIILVTNRCIIRETCLEDLDRLYEIYSGEGMTDFLEPLFEEHEMEKTYLQSYIEHVYTYYGYGMWSILEKESGNVIGRAGIEYKEDEPDSLELGYLIDKSYQKKGYATEVCSAIIKYADEHLQITKLCSYIHPENNASIKLCKKLGFAERGYFLRDGIQLCKYEWNKIM